MPENPLSERDICTKFITPAVEKAGWDVQTQIREEVSLTAGRVIVRGKLVARGACKRADYVLYYKPGLPLAVIEAKDPNHNLGDGMQQALHYAEMLGVPFAFSSNGSGFLMHDNSGLSTQIEKQIKLDDFPSPEALWQRFCSWKKLTGDAARIISQDYYTDASGKAPRYYQTNAINSVVEAVDPGRSNGVPHISTKDIAQLRFRRPPLAEQKRIVAKVDHLMKLCDQLEAALGRSEGRAGKLVEAVVGEMVG